MMTNMELTIHAREERMNRLMAIAETVGVGEIVKTCRSHTGNLMCLTDTGIIVVKPNLESNLIITVYVANVALAHHFYPGSAMLPNWLAKTIKKNHSNKRLMEGMK